MYSTTKQIIAPVDQPYMFNVYFNPLFFLSTVSLFVSVCDCNPRTTGVDSFDVDSIIQHARTLHGSEEKTGSNTTASTR